MDVDMQGRIGNLLNDDNFNEVVACGVLSEIDPKEALNRIVEEWRDRKDRDETEEDYRAKLSNSIEDKLEAVISKLDGVQETVDFLSDALV